jgi:hypothetical protein
MVLSRFVAGLAASGLAGSLLAGCAPEPIQSSPPVSETPVPSPAATTPAPAVTPQVVATDEPIGTLTLADGGPMLWPTTWLGDYLSRTDSQAERYGFVTSSGERIADDYLAYAFCRDASGNPTRALAAKVGWVEVLDLNGKKTKELETSLTTDLSCLNDRYVLSIESAGDVSINDYLIYDLEADKQYRIPDVFWRDDGIRTWDVVNWYAAGLASGSNRVVSTVDQVDYGYRDLEGNWIADPSYTGAEDFANGVALVSKDGLYYVVDEKLEQRPDVYYAADTWKGEYEHGYRLLNEEGKYAYFTADLQPITDWFEPFWGEGEDDYSSEHFWGAWADLPGNEITNLETGEKLKYPEGFLPNYLFAASEDGRQFFNYLNQQTLAVPDGYQASADFAKEGFVNFSYPTMNRGNLLTLGGLPVGVKSAISWVGPQAVGGIYYWAEVGNYKGLLTLDGHWLYKEDRYTTLGD